MGRHLPSPWLSWPLLPRWNGCARSPQEMAFAAVREGHAAASLANAHASAMTSGGIGWEEHAMNAMFIMAGRIAQSLALLMAIAAVAIRASAVG